MIWASIITLNSSKTLFRLRNVPKLTQEIARDTIANRENPHYGQKAVALTQDGRPI